MNIVGVFKDDSSVFDLYEEYKDDLDQLSFQLEQLARGSTVENGHSQQQYSQ